MAGIIVGPEAAGKGAARVFDDDLDVVPSQLGSEEQFDAKEARATSFSAYLSEWVQIAGASGETWQGENDCDPSQVHEAP